MKRAAYIDWLVATSPTTVSRWLDRDTLWSALCADFDQTIAQRVSSPERAAEYARRCPVPGVTAADYCLRELRLFPETWVVAGIHFRNLQVHRPFIGVYAQTRDLTQFEIEAASQRLNREFAAFAPKHVAWWSPEQRDLRGLILASSDQRLVIGRLSELDLTPTPLPKPFVMSRDSSGSSYAAYCRMMAEFFDENPEWVEELSLTDQASYSDCAESGLVVTLETEGQIMGVVAARVGAIRGIAGWEMVDEISGPARARPGARQGRTALLSSRLECTARTPRVWHDCGTEHALVANRARRRSKGRRRVGADSYWVSLRRGIRKPEAPSPAPAKHPDPLSAWRREDVRAAIAFARASAGEDLPFS